MFPLAPMGSLELLLAGSTGSNKSNWPTLNKTDRFVQSASKLFFFLFWDKLPFFKCFLWDFSLVDMGNVPSDVSG